VDGRERKRKRTRKRLLLNRQKREGGDRQLTLKDIVRKLKKTLLGEASERHRYKTHCKPCTVFPLQHQ